MMNPYLILPQILAPNAAPREPHRPARGAAQPPVPALDIARGLIVLVSWGEALIGRLTGHSGTSVPGKADATARRSAARDAGLAR